MWQPNSFWALPKILDHRKKPLRLKAPGPAKGSLVQPFCKSACKLRAKRTFQVQTDLNSSIFSIGIILTSKPKQDFCVKSKSWSYEDGGCFFCFWANVRCAVKMRRQRNHHYLKWIQSSLEGKKNLICCRLFTASKKNHMP